MTEKKDFENMYVGLKLTQYEVSSALIIERNLVEFLTYVHLNPATMKFWCSGEKVFVENLARDELKLGQNIRALLASNPSTQAILTLTCQLHNTVKLLSLRDQLRKKWRFYEGDSMHPFAMLQMYSFASFSNQMNKKFTFRP